MPRADLRWLGGTCAGLLLALACGCSDSSEPTGEELFRAQVAPVLEARCGAEVCHGVRQMSDAEGLPEDAWVIHVDARGRLADWRQAYRASKAKINAAEAPAFSTLLRKPLGTVWGGLAHGGGDNLVSPHDPAYEAIAAWIEREERGGEDPQPAQLGELEAFFSEQVQPHLIGRSCAAANCHGLEAFTPFRLDPGIPAEGAAPRWSVEMTRHNYREARGFLSLDGDPTQSRLLEKSIPLHLGGITHRGGNDAFISGPGDPAWEALIEWAERERQELDDSPDGSVDGVVFVRGPLQAGSIFDPSGFVGGRDLYLLSPVEPDGAQTNLTEHLHDGAADVRDPDVSPEGTHVVFSMRRRQEEGFQLWELDLTSGEARQLTDDPAALSDGTALANLQPVYGPDEYVYFSSNRHDVLAERADAPDLDLFRLPRAGGPIERLTYTPAPEIDPAIFRVAPHDGYLVFSYRRAVDARDKTVGFSFPLDFHVDYHIYFGLTPEANVLHGFSELPDGRSAAIVADTDNVWRGGQLAIVDRNLGPDLASNTPVEQASLPGYAQTLRVLDDQVSPRGVSQAGVYRDPAALPDGSLLAAWAPGPVDLGDPQAAPRFQLVHLEVAETRQRCRGLGCTPSIESTRVLVDLEEESAFSPVPVRRWARRWESDFALDPEEPALFSMIDIGVNDGIMQQLFPAGEKSFVDQARYVRLVEALPAATAFGAGATLAPHMPARILGEVDLHEDQSLYVQVPAGVPFRTQLLDESRMSLGLQHNRWLFVWPGQHFRQSTTVQLYDQRCGGCHGSASGRPEDAWRAVDTTTQASVTLAQYEDRNPRRPRRPIELGESTRRAVDFVADAWPIIERGCASAVCHGGGAGGLALSNQPSGDYSLAYVNLMSRGDEGGAALVDIERFSARRSLLIAIASGRSLQAGGAGGDHPAVHLSQQEVLTLVRWVEVGAPYRIERGEP